MNGNLALEIPCDIRVLESISFAMITGSNFARWAGSYSW
jgi:hypothetical protein